uniref:Uncharacterized protein n=1 Tax=Panagrolaimus sp. PS1159 TaxID=55785 RepID=A0AC35GL07_9BILA
MGKWITIAALALTGLLLLQSIIYLAIVAASFDKINWINECIDATIRPYDPKYLKDHCSDFSPNALSFARGYKNSNNTLYDFYNTKR